MNRSALSRGVSLTLPAVTLKRVGPTLASHGRVRRGYLGVSAQPARLPAALISQLGQETGLLIAAVEPESPAEKAGLFLGDPNGWCQHSPNGRFDGSFDRGSGWAGSCRARFAWWSTARYSGHYRRAELSS